MMAALLTTALLAVPASASGPEDRSGELSRQLNGFRNLVETAVRSVARTVYSLAWQRPKPSGGLFDLEEGKNVFPGGEESEGHWVGAPDALYDRGREVLYLHTRSRTPFQRGHTASVWKTADGEEFEKVWSAGREELGAVSLEGGALRKHGDNYTLYLSYHDAGTREWEVAVLEAGSPASFNASDRTELDVGRDRHLKDPVVHRDTVYVNSPSRYFTSEKTFGLNLSSGEMDRLRFGPGTSPHPRLTSVLEVGGRTLVFYDWKPSIVYTGEEFSRYGILNDSRVVAAGSAPIASREGTGSLRYVDAEKVGEEVWFFYEKSERRSQHSLYLNRIPLEEVRQQLE